MKIRTFLPLVAFLFSSALAVASSGLAGKWTAEFDTQIGLQKYIYEFKQDGEQLSGSATYDHSFGKGTVPLKSVKVEGDKVSFAEILSFDGNEVTITYQGTLASDELKLTRQVGDIATEQLTAKRAPAQP